MMKNAIFFLLSLLFVCSVSHANLLFKMEAPTTDLVVGGPAVTVTISAWADDPAAAGTNGLNGWGLSALVDTDGVADVVDGSVVFLAPTPYSATDTFAVSIDQAVTGGSGSIEDLQLLTQDLPQSSTTAVGGYSPIAQFDIQAAIGAVAGQSVTYTLGEILAFNGLLADFTNLTGQFDVAASQNVFTVVPEPTSLLILSGLGMIGYLRRKQ